MISKENKTIILKASQNGFNATEIGAIMGVKAGTIRQFLCRSAKDAGLPPKLIIKKSKVSATMGVRAKRVRLSNPKASMPYILKVVNENIPLASQIGITTLRNYMKENGFKKAKCAKRTILSKVNKEKRLAFANLHLVDGVSDIDQVIWSDETMVRQYPFTVSEYCYVRKGDPRPVQLKSPMGGISQMFWGSFSKYGTGPLITVDGTMDKEQYLEVLENQVLPELKAAED